MARCATPDVGTTDAPLDRPHDPGCTAVTVLLDPAAALAHTERVVGLLRARRHEVVSMTATFDAGGARLVLRTPGGPDPLLVHRLERLVGVLGVDVVPGRSTPGPR